MGACASFGMSHVSLAEGKREETEKKNKDNAETPGKLGEQGERFSSYL
jgi:hypothetical protein